MAENEVKSIDFRSIQITDLEGKSETIDISKVFGNLIYKMTSDLGAFEAARTIYHDGRIDLTPETRQGLIDVLSDPRCPFTVLLKKKIIEMLLAG